MRAGTEVFVSLALACATSHVALAQSQGSVTATAQFDRGRELMTAGKFEQACKAFEASQQLDPASGTQYNLAGCYVKIGKLASAWAAYRELAVRDSNATRKKDSAAKARALTSRLPKLVIQAPNHPADLVVSLNGLDVTSLLGVDNPIDLGAHQIVARASGYAEKSLTTEIKAEAKTVTVTIELEKASATQPSTHEPVAAAPMNEPAQPQRDDAPRSHRKLVALVVGGAGVALVGTGLYFGNVASGHYDDAERLCPGHQCTGAMLTGANDAYDKAKSSATVSTVLVIGGGVAIAAGIVLLVTGRSDHAASSTAWRITPGVGTEPVGVSIGGGF